MKIINLIFRLSLAIVVFVILFACPSKKQYPEKKLEQRDEFTITGSFALYPLVAEWASEFKKLHPKIHIHVIPGSSKKGEIVASSGLSELGMFSMRSDSELLEELWMVSVAREAVVPVCNPDNPYIDQILMYGLQPEDYRIIYLECKPCRWSDFYEGTNGYIKVYTRSDLSGAAQIWSDFLSVAQADLNGIEVYGDPGMTDAIRNNKNGAGYCNLKYVYDPFTGQLYPHLQIIPFDMDGNGKIEGVENIHQGLDRLIFAIKNGYYPEELTRKLYLIAGQKPTKPSVVEFLKWVFTDGQIYIDQLGYIPLENEIIQNNIRIISSN